MKARQPREYRKGEKVRRDLDGKVYTVKRSYWQRYAGGDTSDWTVELESIDPTQPTPWDKSTNLEPVLTYPCPQCDAANEIVNQCGCDPNNMPTKIPE